MTNYPGTYAIVLLTGIIAAVQAWHPANPWFVSLAAGVIAAAGCLLDILRQRKTNKRERAYQLELDRLCGGRDSGE